jgi:HlyD family secretion protein
VVDLISPEANRQKATVQVRVKVLRPDDLLKPDMNATVSFLSTKKLAATRSASGQSDARPSIRIPAAAVRDGAVFVVENGSAVKRPVATGTTSANGEIEIKKGLIGGEDLITNPPSDLTNGARVKTSGNNR